MEDLSSKLIFLRGVLRGIGLSPNESLLTLLVLQTCADVPEFKRTAA